MDVIDPDNWAAEQLVDPRGVVLVEDRPRVDAWPIVWRTRTVGLLDNSKANARVLLEAVRDALATSDPTLNFKYVRKMSAGEGIEDADLEKLTSVSDAVVLASAD